MIVAGLDIATQTGVCLGKLGQKPEFWTEDLGRGLPHEERGAKLLKLAYRLIETHGVQAIGIEAPVQAKHHRKSQNELLMGLIFNVRSWAALKKIPCKTHEVSHIDVTFLGCAQRSGRDARKAAIWNMCRARGWNPKTQDEADAGSVWETMCVHMSPSYAAQSGSLLSRRTG